MTMEQGLISRHAMKRATKKMTILYLLRLLAAEALDKRRRLREAEAVAAAVAAVGEGKESRGGVGRMSCTYAS